MRDPESGISTLNSDVADMHCNLVVINRIRAIIEVSSPDPTPKGRKGSKLRWAWLSPLMR